MFRRAARSRATRPHGRFFLLDANRNARCKAWARTARAVYAGLETNALCRRPAIVSLAPAAPDHKGARGDLACRRAGLAAIRPARSKRPDVPRALEIRIYLTKVREWTKARCKPFAASIAL